MISHGGNVFTAYEGSGSGFSELMPMLDTMELRQDVERSGVFIDRSQIHMGSEIGSGCFGKVFRGALRTDDQSRKTFIPVAIKTLKGRSP